MIKVGDVVKVDVTKYQGFRGTVIAIDNDMATIEVPTYYGNKDTIIVYQDIRFLKKVDDVL